MKTRLAILATLATLLAPLAACLEVEEEVVVEPDGSVSVAVVARGDESDLAEGFPLPTWGPWRAADESTRAWLAGEPLPEGGPGARVEARFRSVADLPSSWAPPREPYRSAYLERRSELQVLPRGGRTVYVFTRVLRGRRHADWSASARIEAELDDDVRVAVEESLELSPDQWARATALVREVYCSTARALVRSALAAVYTEGDAELPLDGHERILARVESRVGEAISEPRLRELYAAIRAAGEAPEGEQLELPPELDLELVARRIVRAALPAGLEQEAVPPGVRNAVLERLEWSYTALDQTQDLDDEKLVLRLRLPGRIVDGNFATLEDGAAVFAIEGQELHDRDVVWRAVSVLE